ncbi:MAG TPA: GyrI-like domain-containing protein [Gammaproteobacteria bacterium]
MKASTKRVVRQMIPAERRAVLRHGKHRRKRAHSYREWLPASGEELRDFPIFFHCITPFPDVLEGEMLTDIYLPLQ